MPCSYGCAIGDKVGTIGVANMAMAALALGREKWQSLEFIVMTMRAYYPGPASKPLSVLSLGCHVCNNYLCR